MDQIVTLFHDSTMIQSKIYEIRGQRVMLDFDLAAMYGVETRRLNEQVKRNIERFPEDFMFQLTKGEFDIWKSQIVTSNFTDNQHDGVLISQIATSKICRETRRNTKATLCLYRKWCCHAKQCSQIASCHTG